VADPAAAHLVEVFSSVQGEGPWLGTSTLFVRFGECDLRCRWCDSPGTWQRTGTCRIETARGTARFQEIANPVPLDALVAACEVLEVAAHRFVALTGGEPLLQPDAVAGVARALAGRGPRILLETHGVAVEALERVRGHVDVVSMDWKLASDVRRAAAPRGAPAADFHDDHERFLRKAHGRTETCVKIVVTPESGDDEIDEAARRVASVDPAIPLLLQPVTPFGRVRERPPPERLLALEARLARVLRDVRVIPQTHPVWGAR